MLLSLVAGLAATPAGPGDVGALLPVLMFAGRRRTGSGGNRGYGTGVYDPYQCAATCSAQMGYCPAPALLQLEETGAVPAAPAPANGFMVRPSPPPRPLGPSPKSCACRATVSRASCPC